MPMAHMDAHVKAQDVRDFLEAHWPEGSVCYRFSIDFGNQVLAAATRQGGDSLTEVGFPKFIWLGDQKAIVLDDDLTLRLTEHGGVVGFSIAESQHRGLV